MNGVNNYKNILQSRCSDSSDLQYIVLENEGGDGTAYHHLDESYYNIDGVTQFKIPVIGNIEYPVIENEIMTGYAGYDDVITSITLGVFEDINFVVDYNSEWVNDIDIELYEEIPEILNTGGGISNMIMSNKNDYFLTLNPDTLWNENYIDEILEMEKQFFNSNSKNILLVVNKDKSFDQNLIGDFNFEADKLNKTKPLNFIYTGCQILEKKIFKKYNKKSFPMSEVWNDLLSKNELSGFESRVNFKHVTNYDIYNRLLKSN